MKLTLAVVMSFGLLGVGASGVFAHGADEAGIGSPMMLLMMEMMHGSMDQHRTVECDAIDDGEMMEKGEGMMEEMMGHEDHERVEEAMEKDMADHDSLHTMMGMWATGCIGDEAMNTLAERHGMGARLEESERKSQDQINWPMVLSGVVIGVAGGWVGSRFLGRKPQF